MYAAWIVWNLILVFKMASCYFVYKCLNQMTLSSMQTQDLKIKPRWYEAEHTTYRSRRLLTIFNPYEWAGKKHFVSFEPAFQPTSSAATGGRRNHYTKALQERPSKTQNICITFVQCYTNVLFTSLPGCERSYTWRFACTHVPTRELSPRPIITPLSHQQIRLRWPNFGLMLGHRWRSKCLVSHLRSYT